MSSMLDFSESAVVTAALSAFCSAVYSGCLEPELFLAAEPEPPELPLLLLPPRLCITEVLV